jgi:integrase
MAALSKLPSGLWRAQVARQGVRRSATFPTKRAAELWATQQEAEIMAGKRGEHPRKTVLQALERYALEVSPTKRTGEKEALRLAAFGREDWAQKWLVDLTPDDLGKWRDRRALALKPESIRRDLTTLSAVFSTAVKEWRWMPSNPVSAVRWPAPGKARTRLPTWREIRRICRACGYVTGQPPRTKMCEIAHILLISLRTAMRRGEIVGMQREQVDFARRLVELPITKNGDRREVPLSRRALRLMRVIHPQMWTISLASLDALWRKTTRRLGIVDLHLHDARAAALTSMSKRVDVLTLARISGHRDINQLSTYYRETAAQVADRL